jgi:flagellar protein FliL
MATAPKAVPKVVPAEDSSASAPASKGSKKKIVIAVAAAIILLGAGGGAAWLFMGGEAAQEGHAAPAKKHQPAKAPVFLAIEPFTVNLQHENGDQFLQVSFTLQVADQEQVEAMKLYMPLLRSRVLMLLSSKKASELASADGKKKLQDDIIAQAKLPFTSQGSPQEVSGVFFTSFVIQ